NCRGPCSRRRPCTPAPRRRRTGASRGRWAGGRSGARPRASDRGGRGRGGGRRCGRGRSWEPRFSIGFSGRRYFDYSKYPAMIVKQDAVVKACGVTRRRGGGGTGGKVRESVAF